jgi:hypothetical protein
MRGLGRGGRIIIKKELRETECEDVKWSHLDQDMDCWQAVVKTEMYVRVLQMAGNFFTSLATISFLKRTQQHEVINWKIKEIYGVTEAVILLLKNVLSSGVWAFWSISSSSTTSYLCFISIFLFILQEPKDDSYSCMGMKVSYIPKPQDLSLNQKYLYMT